MGIQLAARDRAMQTLCMGQGAMLGVLLGLGLAVVLGLLGLGDLLGLHTLGLIELLYLGDVEKTEQPQPDGGKNDIHPLFHD